MSNPYVLAGYLAAAAVLVGYWAHLRHRSRVLARALGGAGRQDPSPSPSVAAGGPPPAEGPR